MPWENLKYNYAIEASHSQASFPENIVKFFSAPFIAGPDFPLSDGYVVANRRRLWFSPFCVFVYGVSIFPAALKLNLKIYKNPHVFVLLDSDFVNGRKCWANEKNVRWMSMCVCLCVRERERERVVVVVRESINREQVQHCGITIYNYDRKYPQVNSSPSKRQKFSPLSPLRSRTFLVGRSSNLRWFSW